MDSLLQGLNDAQKRAVTSPHDVVQVLAPPGSGKTKTLTARVAYLIAHHGYKPWDIIVCTFTNKAAREMKERIRSLLGDNLEKRLVLGTFHGIALRYLRSYGHYIGIKKDFGIADSNDTMGILKRLKQRHKYTIEPGIARSRISKVKAGSTSVPPLKGPDQQEFAAIYEGYEDALRTANLLDYDDLLLRCADLLCDHGDCVSNIEAVLIDEFQDTNHVQYRLMSLFSQRRHRITIVGDPDQSIYAFRSAEVRNVLKMQKEYAETDVVYLEENYRSAGAILLSALAVIEQDSSRPAKKLLPTHTVGEQPVLRRLPQPRAEGLWIVEELKRLRQLTGGLLTFNDFAILVRSGYQSQSIELALGKAGVPYRMVGGHKFFDRWEIKVLLTYLRVINTPQHNDAIIYVVNEPPRGVGDETVKKMVEEAESRKISLWQLVQNIAQEHGRVETKVRAAQRKGICEFFGLITRARSKMNGATGAGVVVELLDYLMAKLSLGEYIRKKYSEEVDARLENIEELRVQATQLCSQWDQTETREDDQLPIIDGVEQTSAEGPAALLSHFLANVALATDAQLAEDGQVSEQVTISTMHGAKGLEWPVVFVASLFDGSMPHSRAEDHDEERRLLYVAMTRAQALLYLSCPMKSSGGSEAALTVLSPFLSAKGMSPLFRPTGPRVTFSTSQDLARILRRECPAEVKLIEAFEAADVKKDEYWPEDGTEPGRSNDSWSSYSIRDEDNPGYAQKRRRMGDREPKNDYVPAFTAATTMSNALAYSTSSTTMPTTFMSASSCLEQQASIKLASTIRGRSCATGLPPPSSEPAARQKSAPSQGSIKAFFSKQSNAAPLKIKVQECPDMVGSGCEKTLPDLDVSGKQNTGLTKPASSFHATSMNRITEGPKYLGVRRQPLIASRINRPFKPPSRPNA